MPYLVSRGYDLTTAAAIGGLVGAMQLVGRLLLAQFERRLAPTATIAAVYALQPFALLVLLLGPLAVAPYAFVVLFGAGRGADTLIRNTAVARLYGARRFASIQGVLSLIITGAWAGSPVALGAIYDRFGGYEIGLWIVLVASLVALVAIRVGVSRSDRSAR